MKTWLGFVVGLGMVACTEASGSGAATDAVDESMAIAPCDNVFVARADELCPNLQADAGGVEGSN
jgi:hypothetical protein